MRGRRDQTRCRRRRGLRADARAASGVAQGRAAGIAGSAAATHHRACALGGVQAPGRARDMAGLLPGTAHAPVVSRRRVRSRAAGRCPPPSDRTGHGRAGQDRNTRKTKTAEAIPAGEPQAPAAGDPRGRRHRGERQPYRDDSRAIEPAEIARPLVAACVLARRAAASRPAGPAASAAVAVPHGLVAGRLQHGVPVRRAGIGAAGIGAAGGGKPEAGGKAEAGGKPEARVEGMGAPGCHEPGTCRLQPASRDGTPVRLDLSGSRLLRAQVRVGPIHGLQIIPR